MSTRLSRKIPIGELAGLDADIEEDHLLAELKTFNLLTMQRNLIFDRIATSLEKLVEKIPS